MKRSIEDTPIVFIGAGNLATNLAKALYHKGFRIVQVYSRTMESARTLAEKVEAEYTTDLQEISKDAKLYIVSLKDAALVDLLPQITEGKQSSLLVHTAGSIPVSIWEGYAERYGVFYPMQTFSKQREVNFQEVPFFVEAKRLSIFFLRNRHIRRKSHRTSSKILFVRLKFRSRTRNINFYVLLHCRLLHCLCYRF